MTHITHPTPYTPPRPYRCASRYVFCVTRLIEFVELRWHMTRTLHLPHTTDPIAALLDMCCASRYVFCVTWLVEFVELRWHISHTFHPTHNKHPIAVLLDMCSVWRDSSSSWDWDDTYHIPYTLHITNTLSLCFSVWRDSPSSWVETTHNICPTPYT